MPWTTGDVDRHKSGLSARQKRQWVQVANSVLRRCLSDGGSQGNCEASAIRQANGVAGNEESGEMLTMTQANADYSIRTEYHRGRRHLVVPVVMMVEGVHHGSHGSLFHSAEELSRWPAAWNGRPVMVQHPDFDGQPISANDPGLIDDLMVGRVFNTEFSNHRLRGEAWLDELRLREVSPRAYDYISNSRPLEVSIGAFTDDEPTSGEWQGEQYGAIARNHRPDHLALLPGAQGACSWADGCGVRANLKGGENGVKYTDAVKQLIAEGFAVLPMQANEEKGYGEVMSAIQTKLDRMDDDLKVHFLKEVYEGTFIYEIRAKEGHSGLDTALYQREYTVSEDGSIEFDGEPVAVRQKVEYVQASNAFKRTKVNSNSEEVTNMTKKDAKPCCEEKVEMLIQHKHSTFVEADRDWLNGQEEEQIDKLLAMQKKIPDEDVEPPEKKKDGDPPPPPQMNAEQAKEVLKAQLSDPKQFMDYLPEDFKGQVNYGIKLHKEHRQKLIKTITDNSDVYSKEDLEVKDTEELQKLSQFIPKPRDYSGQGDTPDLETFEAGEILLPPGVEEAAASN